MTGSHRREIGRGEVCPLQVVVFKLGDILSPSLSLVLMVERYKWRMNLELLVGSRIRHYWQNGGTAPNPLSSSRRHSPGMKGLAFVILTCFFLSAVELAEKNVKVLFVLERIMRKHKAFCSCAQKIIHKVNHWHLFKDLYKERSRMSSCSLRPREGLLSETYLWGECLWQKKFAELRVN